MKIRACLDNLLGEIVDLGCIWSHSLAEIGAVCEGLDNR